MDTTYLCYSNGDIKKEEEPDEILAFFSFCIKTTGQLPRCLVFDSKLTTYDHLDCLTQMGLRFITLLQRGKKIHEDPWKVSPRSPLGRPSVWISLPGSINWLRIHDGETHLSGYTSRPRQVIVTGTGREMPMILVTNDARPPKKILTHYAKCWRIENNIQENVDFFNLNALAYPVLVKVDFDMAMTLIANTLYKMLSSKIRLFEKAKAKTLFLEFYRRGVPDPPNPLNGSGPPREKSSQPLDHGLGPLPPSKPDPLDG